MQIEIRDRNVEKVVRVWEGKERVSYTQWALLSQGGFVLSFIVQHNAEAEAYAPGFYELDPTSFSSQNGRLSVERVRLKPVAKAQPVKA
ncbi:single-stranded DNA-binding protein [Dokdonella soli]|uniref:Single-stranded DNA-binding protein n=1 Tax=Dokdonella soli TaxID=529810 RepID=A0ABN1IDX2_9GAMM